MSPKLQSLVTTLRQLFLFDRADLDFGMYRIMNARRAEVDAFLKQRLPEIARDRLGAVKQSELDTLEAKVREARQQAESYGVADPDTAPPVVAARRALDQASDLSAVEDQIYSLLVTFFSRYYDDGDFITRRRYSGPGRERYMIPYDGEEVKLVWANMDQYYIKSDECLRDYRFRLPPLPEGEPAPTPETDTRPVVFFKLVEADVAKDNVKTANGERRFALAVSDENPITVSPDGKLLTIPFAHIEHPKGTKQSDLLDAAERALLQNATQELQFTEERQLLATVPAALAVLLQAPVPNKTDPKKTRTLLRFHLDQYAARNTYDYFIHKDLGGFFTRELDYFLKSEVLEIEDLIGQPPEIVERHLRKVQAVRAIAQDVIVFLANLENFQKKLWLKKKFVVETNWCITLDRVPDTLFPEIAANTPQLQEWANLGFIEEKQIPKLKAWLLKCAKEGKNHESKNAPKDLFGKPDTATPSTPSSFSLYLVLDTAFFPAAFKEKLLASIDDIDAQTDGLLIHSENSQALNLLQERYREQVKCIYIDPPYNTGSDGFPYKDSFQHSSWVSLMASRLSIARSLLSNNGLLFLSIDDNEVHNAVHTLNITWGDNFLATLPRRTKSGGGSAAEHFAVEHDYVISWAKSKADLGALFVPHNEEYVKRYSEEDEHGQYFWDTMERSSTQTTPYVITAPDGTLLTGNWFRSEQRFAEDLKKGEVRILKKTNGAWSVQFKQRIGKGRKIRSLLYQNEFKSSQDELDRLSLYDFKHPKPVYLLMELLRAIVNDPIVLLDYFGGSGTTAHAVINLNREDEGERKYVLVEMGDCFDTVLKPRIQKVVFSKDWKDGKPTDPASGVSHCFKYLRLESYEDTLNNLLLYRNAAQQQALDLSGSLKNEYLLGYFLDTETADSPSLLNVLHFTDPWNYRLKIAAKAVGESRPQAVDLVETFNYLIGLTVERLGEPLSFVPDGTPARDADGRLIVKRLRLAERGQVGSWAFQTVEGTTLAGEKTLIVWRTLSDDPEVDSAVLEAYLQTTAINIRESLCDVLYVNGDHTLDNLATSVPETEGGLPPERTFKVRLIETEFRKRMFAEAKGDSPSQ